MTTAGTILIIDDEVQIRRLLEITLSANGYKIAEASTGKEGINLAASLQPLLDNSGFRIAGYGWN